MLQWENYFSVWRGSTENCFYFFWRKQTFLGHGRLFNRKWWKIFLDCRIIRKWCKLKVGVSYWFFAAAIKLKKKVRTSKEIVGNCKAIEESEEKCEHWHFFCLWVLFCEFCKVFCGFSVFLAITGNGGLGICKLFRSG